MIKIKNSDLADLAYYYRLFTTLTWTNFKLRYYGSFLGYFWSLLKPLGLFGVLYIVFTVYMKQATPHYKLFLLLGIILWEFFSQGTMTGMNGFIGNYTLIRKVSLPRIILVMAAVTSSFIGFLANMVIFLVFAAFDGIEWGFRMLWFIPLVISLYMLVTGIGLILSILIVKIRDMLTLWEVAIQLGFWLTPVMYPMRLVPPQWRFALFLNPMSGILEYSRYVLVGIGGVTKIGFCYVGVISLVIFVSGVILFIRKEADMVENL
jgi:ABC-type polysaccharide/polyol phosphate export permease